MKLRVDGADVYAYTGSRAFDPALATLLFVHGAAQDHSAWALQSRYFAHHGRNVLALDLPGHGRSAGSALTSVEAIAAWTMRLLDASPASAGSKVTLIGHSLGALAVLEAAARFPGRIDRIALLGPSVPMVVSDALLAAAQGNEHLAYELVTQWSFAPGHHLGGNQQPGMWMTGGALRLMERSLPDVFYTDLLACHRYAAGLEAAAGVACPALLLIGERDLMAPPKSAQALIAALADPRVVNVRECGHSLMTEAPDVVLDALRGFLE